MSRNFVTCHCHPQSLDSASTPKAFAEREVELGTGYMTVTDHGSLGACRAVYDIAQSKGLVPVMGLEAYFRDDNCSILEAAGIPKKHRTKKVEGKDVEDTDSPATYAHYFKYGHFCVHFLDQAAYELGVRLLSAAPIEQHGSEIKPLFDWAAIEALGAANTTITSGCLVGMVQRFLQEHGDVSTAIKYFDRMKAICRPGHFYTEVFPHVCDHFWMSGVFVTIIDGGEEQKLKFWKGKNLRTNVCEIKAEDLAHAWTKAGGTSKHTTLNAIMTDRKWVDREPARIIKVEVKDEFLLNECTSWAPNGDLQIRCNKFVVDLATDRGVPILISDDSHYAQRDEKIVQDVRLMQSGSWRFHGSYHRQSSEDAWAYFREQMHVPEKQFEEWVDNGYAWAEQFKSFEFNTPPSLPTKFYPPETLPHTIGLIRKHGRMDWNNPVYVDRLRTEFDLLHRNGTIDLLPYFFIDEEVCSLYEANGQLTGPGRGSAAGVLLTYLLGITHADPIERDLSLDRFLTLDRIKSGKLPDIDQDLPDRALLVGDEEQGGWLKDRFQDCYAQISVDITLKLKNAVKDVARVMPYNNGRVPPQVEALAYRFKMPPQGILDYDFVVGYDTGEGHVPGSAETDPHLRQYIALYPEEWRIVLKALGLGRQKGRHACLPATEKIGTVNDGFLPIVQCDKKQVFTGQGEWTRRCKGTPLGGRPQGQATLLDQGTQEVVEYMLDNGKILRCTPDERLLTIDGTWIAAQNAFEQGVELAPSVVRVKLRQNDAETYASSRGGTLLEWASRAGAPSTWKCAEGHVWKQNFDAMNCYEYWCRKCSHQYRFSKSKTGVSVERASGKCLSTYLRYDKKKGFVSDIQLEDVICAKQSPCSYCGRLSTGLERINNKLGHTKSNCIPACLRCNWMRGRYISHEVMLQVGGLLKEIDP